MPALTRRSEEAACALVLRPLTRRDLAAVARIDALLAGRSKRRFARKVFAKLVRGPALAGRVGIGAVADGRLAGYVFGEVRAFEFGSSPCGWLFAIGVDPGWARRGVASALLEAACERFRAARVTRVRTMVRRTDIPVLSFFRARGFAGGPFVQLEREVEDGRFGTIRGAPGGGR